MTASPPIYSSLRNRLVLILIGGAAVLALLLFFVVRNYAAQVAQQGQDNVLGASVTSILDAAVVRDGQVEVDIPYAAFSMLNTPADDRIFYAIYQDDQLLSGYQGLAAQATVEGRNIIYSGNEFQNATVRMATAGRTLIGAQNRIRITVLLAQTQDELSGTLRQISQNAALLGAGFFGLAAMLSVWATSSTIGQLSRLSNSVTRRGPKDLSPFQKPVPTEMAPLVTSLNQLMGRLDQSLRQSEDFIAEAAHRLRTPLATVRSHAEGMMQRVEKEENRKAVRSMVRAIDESSRAATQLLDHAMITFRADHLDRQAVDLVELVRDLVQRLTPIADMKDLELRMTGDSNVTYSCDPILIANAVRNLVDNALKYAPSESRVEVRVTRTPSVQISVLDRGPGYPDAELATLSDRFQRGTNAQGTTGSGLGLTIARDVANAHGGTLKLTNLPEGGACACLSL